MGLIPSCGDRAPFGRYMLNIVIILVENSWRCSPVSLIIVLLPVYALHLSLTLIGTLLR
jgi:hypothetical protein